ncbi:unnamed protein product (macronuclear) [Paramecium tetraurelia]|uniref:Uncharacterized protein n=1 Tax=Paramecium tetraurelia TaxID=5888 RepID=A0E0R3_PARTE|nr:uncharacterized protein GSPATT00022048001 [Paramecium tetraurelia]CAK88880.1 unnamed protein product [Paramecium tetraurelia]|eukprot:XP_001456277.1 hypothetical protein (macronuclear) [Paramecium tetraurelia strain d4-2]
MEDQFSEDYHLSLHQVQLSLIHLFFSQNRTITHLPTVKRIKQFIKRNKLILQVKDRLIIIGYIYPKMKKPISSIFSKNNLFRGIK